MKIVISIVGLLMIIGCNGFKNRFIEESQDKFNPELTSLYNQILKKPNSESRILGITHYSLTSQTIKFLDTLKSEINNLKCDTDDLNCTYKFLDESTKGNMLKEYLTNAKSNYRAMCKDSLCKFSIENKLSYFDLTDHWIETTFKNRTKKEIINILNSYIETINQSSLPIMKRLLKDAA